MLSDPRITEANTKFVVAIEKANVAHKKTLDDVAREKAYAEANVIWNKEIREIKKEGK